MLRIHKIIILNVLLSCGSFGNSEEDNYDNELDAILMDANVTTTTTVKPERELSYRSVDTSIKANTTTTTDGFNLSQIFQLDEEVEDLGCGFHNVHDLDAVSGQRAKHVTHFAEFPWVVAIRTNDGIFMGGGTLIAPDIVLTLASVFDQSTTQNLRVVAGDWDVDSDQEIMPHLNRAVESIIKHPEYDSFINDIALVVLLLGFNQQPNIRTICLSTPATVIDHSLCLSTAWSPPGRGKLNKFSFQIQPRNVCEQRLPSPYGNNMDPTLICSTDLEDFASPLSQLNSGAALFCPMKGNPDRYTQTGIFIGTTDRNGIKTRLFVNVNQFMPWIFKQLGPRNTNLKYYLP